MQTLERDPIATARTSPRRSASRRKRASDRTLGPYLRWVLAACSASAAVIHFAMMGPHFEEGWRQGTFFAVAGWTQLLLAGGLVFSRRRIVLVATVGVNAAIIGVWVLSRTAGVPIGPNAWTPEPFAFVDILCAVLEGILVLGGLALLSSRIARRPVSVGVGVAGAFTLGLVVVVLSALAFVPAFAGSTGHTHGAGEVLAGGEALAHVHDHAATSGHEHPDTTDVTFPSVQGTDGSTQLNFFGNGPDPMGQSGPVPWQPIIDPKIRKRLATQITEAQEVAAKYPTPADAAKAGYVPTTKYTALVGADWTKWSLVDTKFDPSQPEQLLYSRNGMNAEIVGLSYYVVHPGSAPAGFAGPNDPWHQHVGLCWRGKFVVGTESISKDECASLGGEKDMSAAVHMVHAWVVPGWESPWGTFAGGNPDLTFAGG